MKTGDGSGTWTGLEKVSPHLQVWKQARIALWESIFADSGLSRNVLLVFLCPISLWYSNRNPVDNNKNTPIYKLRHSLAHILAQAVLELKPDAKLGFGPPVDGGFYYDFDFGDEPIGQNDLKEVQKRMLKIIKQKQEFEGSFLSPEESLKMLEAAGQTYKVEYMKELVATGKAVDGNIGFWKNGPFIDMCEGPHLEHTGEVPKGAFKLDRVAGSYWRGDEKNNMLTRIYGLAFESNEELKDYIARRELAKARDHRKLGAKLDFYVIDEEVGSGLPLWLPNGTVVRDELEKWAKEEEFKGGYQRVSTPSLTKETLYYTSGHLPYYKESMFPPMEIDGGVNYYLRPMNCPHHHKVFSSRPKSYRDMPLRIAEYGDTFRYEKHGSLSGLMRVRAMCMNDAHIYCSREQVEEEMVAVMALYRTYYDHLRLGDFRVRLSLHSADNEKFVDMEEQWLESEDMVRRVLTNAGIEFTEEEGEAAFYGPKIDIQIKNVLGREETVSTCQLDFLMAERFGLSFINESGEEERPYIIHRAPLSTHERLVSFLIEAYGGAFPTWLAPVQAQIILVSDVFADYAKEIRDLARSKMLRIDIDDSSNSFNKKIRTAITSKIPNIWIIGERENEERKITWRRYGHEDQVEMGLEEAIAVLEKINRERLMDNFADVEIQ